MKNELRKKLIRIKKKGFTLAELLIVVAIIAVLVAVSIPVFSGKMKQSRVAANEANIRSAKAAAISDWMDTAKNEKKDSLWAAIGSMFLMKVMAGSGQEKYDIDGNMRIYGYDIGTNDLFKPNGNYEIDSNTSVYKQIFVKIDTESCEITTNPHVEGNGSNKNVVLSFGTNSSDTDNDSNNDEGGGNQSQNSSFNSGTIVNGSDLAGKDSVSIDGYPVPISPSAGFPSDGTNYKFTTKYGGRLILVNYETSDGKIWGSYYSLPSGNPIGQNPSEVSQWSQPQLTDLTSL